MTHYVAALSGGNSEFRPALVFSCHEADQIHTLPAGWNVLALRGLGFVWLRLSIHAHSNCPEYGLQSCGLCDRCVALHNCFRI